MPVKAVKKRIMLKTVFIGKFVDENIKV